MNHSLSISIQRLLLIVPDRYWLVLVVAGCYWLLHPARGRHGITGATEANNQWDVGAELGSDPMTSAFARVLTKGPKEVAMVLDKERRAQVR